VAAPRCGPSDGPRPRSPFARPAKGRRVRMVDRRFRDLGISILVACSVIAASGAVAAHASGSGSVPCSGVGGGAAGLVAAVDAANASGGGTINLASGCTYSLTSANNTVPGLGANGLPVITAPITINGGSGATISGNNSN